MLLIVGKLPLSTVTGGVECGLNGFGNHIRIENDASFLVPSGATRGLYQAGGAAEEAFFIGIEYGYERDFGKVEAFAQKVDPDEHVEVALAQTTENLHALDSINIGVQIFNIESSLAQVVAKVFGHTLSQGGGEGTLVRFRGFADFANKIFHLPIDRTDLHLGVDEASRTNDLLGNHFGYIKFVLCGCRGNVNCLPSNFLKLFFFLRTVIHGRGQAEAEVDEALFTRAVAVIHGANLWKCDVTLVDKKKGILREEIDQTERACAGLTPRKVTGVVFDTGAKAHLLE